MPVNWENCSLTREPVSQTNSPPRRKSSTSTTGTAEPAAGGPCLDNALGHTY